MSVGQRIKVVKGGVLVCVCWGGGGQIVLKDVETKCVGYSREGRRRGGTVTQMAGAGEVVVLTDGKLDIRETVVEYTTIKAKTLPSV